MEEKNNKETTSTEVQEEAIYDDSDALYISKTKFCSKIFSDFAWKTTLKGKTSLALLAMALAWIAIGVFKLTYSKDLVFGVTTISIAVICIPLIAIFGAKKMAKNLYSNFHKHSGGTDHFISLAFYEKDFVLLNLTTEKMSRYSYNELTGVSSFLKLATFNLQSRQTFLLYKDDFLRGDWVSLKIFLKAKAKNNRTKKQKTNKDL